MRHSAPEPPPVPHAPAAHLQGALNALDVVVYTIDRDFRITMVNESWDQFAYANGGTGLTSAHIIGRNLLDNIRGPEREELRAVCEAIFRGELSRHDYEADVSSPEVWRIYHISITPVVTDAGITGATFTSRDVTHYKLLLAEVAEQQRQLERAAASLKRREARVSLLQRTAEALNAAQSLSATLRVIADSAVGETGILGAIVYVVVDGERLVTAASSGIAPMGRGSKIFWLDSAVAHAVFTDGRPIVVDDVGRESGLTLPPLTGGIARAMAAVPIGSGECKGVLEVYAAQPDVLDADNQRLLHVLAEHAATAIRGAEVMARERRQTRLLRLLNRVAERLASELNEQALMRFVTEALVQQLGMAFARVWLYDEHAATLVLRSSSGLYTDTGGRFGRIKLGQHTVGRIAAERQPVVTNDVASDPGLGEPAWATATGIRSFVGYPLIVRDRLLGVLAFFGHVPLDPGLVTLLEPLVHQVALALERSTLYVAQVSARRDAQHLARLAGTRAAQLSATLAAMTDGVWSCDRAGRVLTINDAALAMFGYEPGAKRIANLDDIGALFDDDPADPDACLGLRTALEGRTVHRELVLRPTGATRSMVVVVVSTPMRDVGGEVTGAVAVVRDVTEQKTIDRLKDDFLSMAAHELKTPVTAIKGYAQLALTRLQANADKDRLQRALSTIDQQAERISDLVQELLDVSRIQEGQLILQRKRFDLVALVRSCIEDVAARAPHHRLTLDTPEQLHGAWDQLRIEQVLQNLLDNAVKYSPRGGEIRSVVEVREGWVTFTVRDPGVGIASDKQPRIFEPWFQAHTDTVGDYGGMGLGLSICKEIVQRHGGRIWLESQEGAGSTFGFALPLTDESGAGQRDAA